MRYLVALLFLSAVFAYTISDCITINTPGYYELTNNITANVKNCITINSSDVTLDCKGYAIINNLSDTSYYHGIKILSPSSNVTVNNCSISNYHYGAIGVYTSGEVTINNTYIDAVGKQYGMYIHATPHLTLKNSKIEMGNRRGHLIYVYSSSSAGELRIINNSFYKSEYGISPGYARIEAYNNLFSDIGAYGIYRLKNNDHVFMNNNVTIIAGGAFVYADVSLSNITMIGNNVTKTNLILVSGWLNNSVIRDNYVKGRGLASGVYTFLVNGKVGNSDVTNNVIVDAYGAISGTMVNSTFENNIFNVSHPFWSRNIDCYSNSIVNNTAWGKPFFFLNRSNVIYENLNVGCAYLCNSKNITFINVNITKGGLELQNSSDVYLKNFYLSGPLSGHSGVVFATQNVVFEDGKIENYRMYPSKNLLFSNITLTDVFLDYPINVTMKRVIQTDNHVLMEDLNKVKILNSTIYKIGRGIQNLLMENSSITAIGGSTYTLNNVTVTNSELSYVSGKIYNMRVENTTISNGYIFLNSAQNVTILNNVFSSHPYGLMFEGAITNLTLVGNVFNNSGTVFSIYSTSTFSNITQANNTVFGYDFYFFNPGSPIVNINDTSTFFVCYNESVDVSNISFSVPSKMYTPSCVLRIHDSKIQVGGWEGGGTVSFYSSEVNLSGTYARWYRGNRKLYNSTLRIQTTYTTPMYAGSLTAVNSTIISDHYVFGDGCSTSIVNITNSYLKGSGIFNKVQGNLTNSTFETSATCIYGSADLDVKNSQFKCDYFAYARYSITLNMHDSKVFAKDYFFSKYGSGKYKLNLSNNIFVAFPDRKVGIVAPVINSEIKNNIFICSQKSGYKGGVNFMDGTNVNISNNVFQDCSITWNPNIAWNTTYDCNTTNIIGSGCLGGNYYSQYNGTDADNDGIGDTPYGYDALPLKAHRIDFNGTPWYPAFNTTNPVTFAYHTKYGNGTVGTDALKRYYPDPFTLKYTTTKSLDSTYKFQVTLRAQDIINQTNFTITVQDFDLNTTQNVSNEYPAYGWIMPKEPISGKPISFEANISGNVTFMLTNGTHWLCYREGWQACNESMDAKAISEHIDEWPYEELNWKAIIGAGGVLHWVRILAEQSS